MAGTPDGFTLIPAPDEPANAGRHIPLPTSRAASALARGAALQGRRGTGMGGILGGPFAGPLPEILGALLPYVTGAAGGAATVAVAWLNARGGRRVKVKDGDFEAEAGTVADLERVMALAKDRHRPPT